ncbi:MAG: YbaK/EbsC family protein [Treponemataceae bacterium]|nr:MAG: YbaK/EbsC family protein [Treponemataceae bacterium]
MSLENAKMYLAELGLDSRVLEFDVSSATVELAAKALGVDSARIAKTLSFVINDSCILILAAGDAKIDNKKYRAVFGAKAKMLAPDQVEQRIGHAVGGVCPFGIKPGIAVYLDKSLERFQTVFPACGSANSAIEMTVAELKKYSGAKAVIDVCAVIKIPRPEGDS